MQVGATWGRRMSPCAPSLVFPVKQWGVIWTLAFRGLRKSEPSIACECPLFFANMNSSQTMIDFENHLQTGGDLQRRHLNLARSRNLVDIRLHIPRQGVLIALLPFSRRPLKQKRQERPLGQSGVVSRLASGAFLPCRPSIHVVTPRCLRNLPRASHLPVSPPNPAFSSLPLLFPPIQQPPSSIGKRSPSIRPITLLSNNKKKMLAASRLPGAVARMGLKPTSRLMSTVQTQGTYWFN